MRQSSAAILIVLVLLAAPAAAVELVPFRGTWEGSTVSAEFVAPGVVLVVSAGTGEATELGRFEMSSPHYTYLADFTVEGEQNFTAANGDALNATFSGQLLPNADGNLEGTLDAEITGGTGRFEGATGAYEFHIVARPAAFGFDSTATIAGSITTVGGRP